jgi:hypothetical protein
MSKIYGRAEQVLIWLGISANGSDQLMDNLAIAAQKCKDCSMEAMFTRETFNQWLSWSNGLDDGADQPRRRPYRELCKELVPLIDVDAMKAWFLRSWFHRVWTVQEFCLAKEPTFICGNKSIPADDVKFVWIAWVNCPADLRAPDYPEPTEPRPTEPTAENVQKGKALMAQSNTRYEQLRKVHEVVFLDPFTPLTTIRKKRQLFDASEGPGHSMFAILKNLMGRLGRTCTDKRDWIYGLTALPNDQDTLRTVPDYSPSCTTVSVYCQFTRKVIESGNLEILRYSRYPKSYQSNFPSWVPDWNAMPNPGFSYEDDKQRIPSAEEPGLLFHAGGDTKVGVVSVMDNEQLLGLRGFVVDEIEELGTPWLGSATETGSSPHRLETLSFLTSVRLLCLLSATRSHPIYRSEQRRLEAIWRIPIADIVRVYTPSIGQHNARATLDCEEGFRNVCAYEAMHQDREFLPSSDTLVELPRMIARESSNGAFQYRNAMRNMENKRPFMTRLGYVGLGPLFAKPGDRVVVFKGAAIPFLVRPVEERGNCFLGEAYCDGIMDGEIVGQREEETIVLV